MKRVYACIDLKSFYASCEAVERGLDPFVDNLVVADESRGKSAITLAITPAMKKLGVKNRCRLFEIPDGIEYIIAKPRMKLYMEYSAKIYSIYLKYVSSEDIHIYSIDECFFDLTSYISLYNMSAKEICVMIMNRVMAETGICATCGIGDNLFLCKVALDITAKHSKDNIGYLDKQSFDENILNHRPITDIWGIGRGTANRLKSKGILDLEGVKNIDENILKSMFGINYRILLDHANGIETCTISDIKKHKAKNHSVSNSQILFSDYNYSDAWIVLREMIEVLVLEIVDLDLETSHISLRVGYSKDIYKSTGGSRKINISTNSFKYLEGEFLKLYRETTNNIYPIRKLSISLGNLCRKGYFQLDLFGQYIDDKREEKIQKIMIDIKKKYGKNSILRASSLQDVATARIRNKLVGGHNGE